MCAGISFKYYRMEPEAYNKLLMTDNHDYHKKTDEEVEKNVNTGVLIAAEVHIDVCVYKMKRRKAVVTLLDHKANFPINMETRLLFQV